MSSALAQVFTFADHHVRTVLIGGQPWFVAADVCTVLGYGGGARNAVGRLPERMRGVEEINTPGGKQRVAVVSEPGVYRLVMRSSLPSAEAFQDWVAEEVVPSLRQTGRYEVEPAQPVFAIPQTYAEALRLAADQAVQIEAQAAQIAVVAPKADAWDVLASASGDWSVADAAKVLSRDPNIKVGRDRLFTYMEGLGWIHRARGDNRYRVYQAQIETGRLSELPSTHYHPRTGQLVLDPPQVRITTKGLHELRGRLVGAR